MEGLAMAFLLTGTVVWRGPVVTARFGPGQGICEPSEVVAAWSPCISSTGALVNHRTEYKRHYDNDEYPKYGEIAHRARIPQGSARVKTVEFVVSSDGSYETLTCNPSALTVMST